jgi:hypothetical protein
MRVERVKRLLKKAGHDWIILIVALLLASFMWTIQNFSKSYSKYFSYKVILKSFIPGRSQKAVSENVMVIRGKSSGYYILRKKYTKRLDQIEISVDPKLLNQTKQADKFFVINENIMEQVQNALGDDLQLEWFASDTLFFVFPSQYNKKIPIIPRTVLKYSPQFMPVTPLIINPDSIVIYGEKGIISGVNSVSTNVIEMKSINNSFQGIVSLMPIKNVEFSQKEVSYSQKVIRYVENTITIPISVVNFPIDVNVIMIPREVTLRYRVDISNKKRYSISDFKIVADYDELELPHGNKLLLRLVKYPNEIKEYNIEPKFSEFIIN